MKLSSPIFASLLVACVAAQSQGICPAKNEQTDTIDNFTTVTYYCKKQISGSTLSTPDAADFPACVAACTADRSCHAGQWIPAGDVKCQLYAQASKGELRNSRTIDAFILARRDDTVPPTLDDIFACQADLAHCEAAEAALEASLTQCQANGQNSTDSVAELQQDLENCRTDLANQQTGNQNSTSLINELQAELENCKNDQNNRPSNPNQGGGHCDGCFDVNQICQTFNPKDKQEITVGNGVYLTRCHNAVSGTRLENPNADIRGCIEACNRNSTCTGWNYYPRQPNRSDRCWLYQGKVMFQRWIGPTYNPSGILEYRL